MEASSLKNMVILRNLPSNLVEEAIIILKQNKKVKKLEPIEKGKGNGVEKQTGKGKEYILKEAEMLVTDYISKIEKTKENPNQKLKKKYQRVKKYAYIATIITIIEMIFLILK